MTDPNYPPYPPDLPSDWQLPPSAPLLANRTKLQQICQQELHPDVFQLKPLLDRVVVARERPPEKLGSLYTPDTAKEPLAAGWILAVGPDVQLGWPHRTALLGCKVLFGQYAGDVIQVGQPGENLFESMYVMLPASSLWGVIGDFPATSPV